MELPFVFEGDSNSNHIGEDVNFFLCLTQVSISIKRNLNDILDFIKKSNLEIALFIA